MNDFVFTIKNLFRNRLRAALMIASISVAFAIFGVLAAFERAFNAGQNVAEADTLVVVNKINFAHPLPLAYVDQVRSIEGVRRVTYATWLGGYYQHPKNSLIVVAVEPETYVQVLHSDFDVTPEMRQAFLGERTGALVGEAMAQKWGWKVGDRLPIASSLFSQNNGLRSWDVTIIGIFGRRKPQVDTNRLILRFDYFNETRAGGKDTIGWLLVQTTSPAVTDFVARAIDQVFANSSYETATDREKAFNKAFMAQFGNIALIVQLVVGAAFLTILMIVGNTMAMTVRERSREIGVLKVLGFSSGRVLRLILGEALLLAFIGGLPGLAIASLAVLSMQQSVLRFAPGMTLDPSIFVIAFVLMVGLGLATGLAPAINAYRLKVIELIGR